MHTFDKPADNMGAGDANLSADDVLRDVEDLLRRSEEEQ